MSEPFGVVRKVWRNDAQTIVRHRCVCDGAAVGYGQSCACYGKDHHERMAMHAKNNGLYVVYPKPNELFVDIDTEDQAERMLSRVTSLDYLIEVRRKISTSGSPHAHIVVTLDRNVGPMWRIILQWWLGSDPMREWMSLKRWLRGDRRPTCFFEQIDPTTGAYR
jgi:hypothetical protein